MLKKMRLRFILSAMAAFGPVMLVLVSGINLINYSVTTAREDEMIAGIMEYEQMRRMQPTQNVPRISEMPWADGPEADFTLRFFAVHCDQEGNVLTISSDHVSAVDEDTIRKYTEKIISKDSQKGFYKEYRYMMKKDGKGSTIIFLNVSGELRFMKSLFMVSLIIAIVSLFVVFLLIVKLSQRAIRPYVKNIERQKRFITDAGHELKTPLTSIATSADILAMEHEGDEWVENIQKQTSRLTRLVSDLVALSRLDEETPFPEKEVFSLSEAAWEAAEPFAALAKAGGKAYTQHIEEHLELSGDRNAIQQMLSILLDNAVRYSEEGGEIRLDIYRSRGRICIEVFNTCELHDITDLNRLFDRFYRMDESRSTHTGGTGIGLSMAQAIAEIHGGKITVNSTEGKSILFKAVF